MQKIITFQEIIMRLQSFWAKQGCVIIQPIDLEVGAGTLSPHTFLRVLNSKPWKVAYPQQCRRPADGRFGENPNRVQKHNSFQVILKPAPKNCQSLYLDSLRKIGLNPEAFDVRFIEDDWEHPALGACGVGWEVWAHGMEISQFTYFQQCGGIDLKVVSCELTYGLERLAMYIQDVNNIYDIVWAISDGRKITYDEVCRREEVEWSRYNFNYADNAICLRHFNDYEKLTEELIEKKLPLPAYECVLKCSHLFNLLDAKKAVSATERATYISRIRDIAKKCAHSYMETRGDHE